MHYRFHNSFSNISLWGIFSEDPIENEGVRPVTTFFPHCKGKLFGCHGNQSFDPICPKTLCRLSPTPMMLQ